MATVDPVVRASRPPATPNRPPLLTLTPLARSQAFFSKSGSDGVSVRSHLAELIHKLLLTKDADALAKLESLSLEVKKAHFDAAQPGSKVRAAAASRISAVCGRAPVSYTHLTLPTILLV